MKLKEPGDNDSDFFLKIMVDKVRRVSAFVWTAWLLTSHSLSSLVKSIPTKNK